MSIRGDVRSLEERVEELKLEIKKLTAQREDAESAVGYSDQIVRLRKQVSDLEIQKDQKKEEFARERREIEHMVGLERKRSEQEREHATREAELKVREANLSTEQKSFEDRMEFMVKELTGQVDYLKDDIIKAVLGVLNVAVTKDIQLGDKPAVSRSRSTKS